MPSAKALSCHGASTWVTSLAATQQEGAKAWSRSASNDGRQRQAMKASRRPLREPQLLKLVAFHARRSRSCGRT